MSTVLALATLVVLDALLAGFRAAAGRNGRIAKAPYYRGAVARAAMVGVAVVAANGLLVAALVMSAPDAAAAWQELLRAGERCVLVFGAFATLTLLAMAFWLAPVRELRLVPTLLVLGPLTLMRPLVIVGGLINAAVRETSPRVWLAALAAGISMLVLERVLGRPYVERWRHLV